MSRLFIALALLAAPGAALAQTKAPATPPATAVSSNDAQQAESGQPPKRIRDISLAAGQPCPKPEGNEVVVCHPLVDPYRIPKPLRHTGPIGPADQSWVNRTATADAMGRKAGGLPDTCSTIGSGGQTGCTAQMLRDWTAEQRAKRNGEQTDDSGQP